MMCDTAATYLNRQQLLLHFCHTDFDFVRLLHTSALAPTPIPLYSEPELAFFTGTVIGNCLISLDKCLIPLVTQQTQLGTCTSTENNKTQYSFYIKLLTLTLYHLIVQSFQHHMTVSEGHWLTLKMHYKNGTNLMFP